MPEPSITIKNLKIFPGDVITASVVVNGTEVLLWIKNRTRNAVFSKRVTLANPDLTSAEWIAEAPSECTSDGFCRQVPLANFGSVTFTKVAALATIAGVGNQGGTIASTLWQSTPIQLVPRTQRFYGDVVERPDTTTGSAGATPLGLTGDGELVQRQLGRERNGVRLIDESSVGMRMKRLMLVLALLALAAPGAASAAASPAQIAVRVATVSFAGKQGAQWDSLHPKYKAVVTRARFVACERKAAAAIGKIKVLDVSAEGTQVVTCQAAAARHGRRERRDARGHLPERCADEQPDRRGRLALGRPQGALGADLLAERVRPYKAGKCP